MAITTVLTVNGTSYTASQRAEAGIVPTELARVLDGGYDSFAFAELSLEPWPTFNTGMPVSVTINGTVRFQGRITDVQSGGSAMGWAHGYTALGLRYLADWVPVTAVDGTGTQTYNRTPEDDYAVPSDVGLTVGEIISRILLVVGTAQALNAVNVGNYTGLPSAPSLPAATVADLALLDVVPPSPVTLCGEGIFNQLAQLVERWHPTNALEIEPDGTIRCKNMLDSAVFVPATITLPGPGGPADPVTWPSVRKSTQDCATRLVMRGGPDVAVIFLSLADGTLAEVFTTSDKSTWTLYDFTQPNGAVDFGTVTAVTSTSVTVQSSDPAVHWVTNFWSNAEAWITLTDTAATGINVSEARIVTSNTAMTAGGTATLTWDNTWPITATSYDKYRVVGKTGGLINTWRDYTPREPSTGATGLNTWVGSHLVVRAPYPVQWANATTSRAMYYPSAMVCGNTVPVSVPATIQPVPSEGIFRFQQPTVCVFGQTSTLESGSPTTIADGLPSDVQILALYSRGPLSVTVPADVAGVPQYEGTAYTEDGIEQTRYMDYGAWIQKNDGASFATLAQKHLDSIKNTVYEGTIDWLVDSALPSWDWLSFETSLNIAINGASSPWASINAPIRSVRLTWSSSPQGFTHRISLGFSTRMKPFSGDDLYVHPQFSTNNMFQALGNDSGQFAHATSLFGMMHNGGMSGMAEGRNNFTAAFGHASGQRGIADPGNFGGGDMGRWGGNMENLGTDPGRYGSNMNNLEGLLMQPKNGENITPQDIANTGLLSPMRQSQGRPRLKGKAPKEKPFVPVEEKKPELKIDMPELDFDDKAQAEE